MSTSEYSPMISDLAEGYDPQGCDPEMAIADFERFYPEPRQTILTPEAAREITSIALDQLALEEN